AVQHLAGPLAQPRQQRLQRRAGVEQGDRHGPLPYAARMDLLVLASLTDLLVRFATNVVGDLGLAGVFVLMLLESACIPIPSEATMLFAGFNVHNGEYSLLAITVVGTAGNLVGSWIAYAVGYLGRVELLERHG